MQQGNQIHASTSTITLRHTSLLNRFLYNKCTGTHTHYSNNVDRGFLTNNIPTSFTHRHANNRFKNLFRPLVHNTAKKTMGHMLKPSPSTTFDNQHPHTHYPQSTASTHTNSSNKTFPSFDTQHIPSFDTKNIYMRQHINMYNT